MQNRATEAEKAADSHNASVAELTQANTKLELEREDMRRLVDSYRQEGIGPAVAGQIQRG